MKKILCAVILALLILPNICGASKLQKWEINGEYHAVYPSVDPETDASEIPIYNKIGDKINEVMKDFWNSVSVTGGFIKSNLNYEITCDKNNILSMVFTTSLHYDKGIYEKDAAGNVIPFMYKQTLNFDMRTGDVIEPDNLKNISAKYNFTPQDVIKKVKSYATKNNLKLNADLEKLNVIPQRYYIDENMHVHFIFAAYEFSQTLHYSDFVDIDMSL